ncbi:VWA domain-containing protein [Pontibacter sp. G13]|uniref:VWA domain-containing protein n=1 Tax=Pontibacter sp. G13 TaxID=3074898 RepID=UPI00288BC0D8|nr:VWA domain-containing protein [Pontibacter sp. G13]WNJ20240.1 VWA domain-containing protein [Pontibacter sp. G13]
MKQLLGIDLFANPEALLLLLLIPFYVFWYGRYFRKQRLVIRLSYDPGRLTQPKMDLSPLRLVPRLLQLLGLALLILAIARPQTESIVHQRQTKGIEIMMLMDISASMEATDFRPNRLEVAKENAANFIKLRKHDKMGMVLFAHSALNYAPLTMDHDYLMRMTERIRPGLIHKEGTALGDAVAMGINRLRQGNRSQQVMVILTDGANNRGNMDPVSAAKLAAAFGVKLYTIGIGSKSYKNLSTLRQTRSELDEEVLQRMATLSGGKFYRVKEDQMLKRVYEEISQLEQTDLQDVSHRLVEDEYPFFIKLAILCFSLSFTLMLSFMYNPLEQ